MRLGELQRHFSEQVRDGGKRHDLPIIGDGLCVYQNNYRQQLRSALQTGFPHLALWLGDSQFEQVSDAHVRLHFPSSWTLDHYGDDFPATTQALFPEEAEIAELAWLDWAMAEALVAEDQAPVDMAHLAELDWEVARVHFVSSLRISEAQSNAAEIWSAIEEDLRPPPATFTLERHALVVWRRGLVPCFRSIPTWEFQVISALRSGFSFGNACEMLRLRFGANEAISAAGKMLARWLSDELIARIDAEALSEV
jgi:hypothetical protein